MRSTKPAGVVALLLATMTVLGSAVAWACVPGSGSGSKKLTVSPSEVKPGDQLTVSAPDAAVTSPVEIRLNATNGPLLGTVVSDRLGLDGDTVSATVTVPLDARPGRNVVLAVQEGVKWDPVLLGIVGADGTVPDQGQSELLADADGGAGGGGPLPAVVTLGALAVAAIAARSALGRRRKHRAEASAAVTP